MISAINEHFLIASTLILFCYGITYKLSNKYQYANISKSVTLLGIIILLTTLSILIVDIPMHTIKYNSLFVKDYTSYFVEFITLCLALGTILVTIRYNTREKIPQFEYIILILCVTIAIHLLVTVEDIFALYLILEFQNICVCILIAIKRNNESIDAAIKSLIVGSIASAILLAGFAILYDISGGMTNFEELSIFFKSINKELAPSWMMYISISLISIGLFLKVYISPFHMWVSDIYASAPNSSLLMISTTSVMPIFMISHKIYVGILLGYNWFWEYIIHITCIVSIVIGTIGAIYQSSIKRMLAYSSIANAGYIFISFVSHSSIESISSSIAYLTVYVFNIFGILSLMTNIRFNTINGEEYTLETTHQLTGLYHKNKLLAVMMAIYSYTMAGLPPFSFFFLKMGIFVAVLNDPKYMWLAIIMAIATSIAVFYYLRMVQLMYFETLKENNVIQKVPFIVSILSFIIVTMNVFFYIYSTEIMSIILHVTYDLYT